MPTWTSLVAALLLGLPAALALPVSPAAAVSRAQSPELEADTWFNVQGDVPTLEGLRGRAVLIEFWATW